MPLIDNFSFDNYGLDGPDLSQDGLKYKSGSLTVSPGAKSITGIGFRPMVLLVRVNWFPGAGGYNFLNSTSVCWRGGNSTSSAQVQGYTSAGAYNENNTVISNVVFTDDGVSFDISLTGVQNSLIYDVFGL
ncbi:hypothetical protein KQI74_28310 [Paenibacillus barcinonensis]|uniref:hypothetical protein n=1 Tax=Paenibacillus barcinonensis TaxID=198119 RepID=UPI001C0F9599|nr:hypothetical protein [Paenibacillus barcinonensis]MBU5356159.1 hypothetical protein [Paenibacillus barcinonensis]